MIPTVSLETARLLKEHGFRQNCQLHCMEIKNLLMEAYNQIQKDSLNDPATEERDSLLRRLWITSSNEICKD